MKAVIHIRGGVAESVYVDDNIMKVIIIDHDVEGISDEHVQEFHDKDSKETFLAVAINEVQVNKEHVDAIFKQAIL